MKHYSIMFLLTIFTCIIFWAGGQIVNKIDGGYAGGTYEGSK